MGTPGGEGPPTEGEPHQWNDLPDIIELEGDPFPLRIERPYDPARDLWKTRGMLARRLLYLLAATILFPLFLVAFERISPEQLKTVLEPILPPLFALVGTALGFYFGGSGRPGG